MADSEAAWALEIGSSDEVAQEVFNPLDTFTISFDYAFSANNSTSFLAKFGNLNLFELAGVPFGNILPDGTNTGMYKHFTITLGRDKLQTLTDTFIELSFSAFGGPDSVFIDNITFMPTPGAGMLGLAAIGFFAGRRRRN